MQQIPTLVQTNETVIAIHAESWRVDAITAADALAVLSPSGRPDANPPAGCASASAR